MLAAGSAGNMGGAVMGQHPVAAIAVLGPARRIPRTAPPALHAYAFWRWT